MMKIQYEKLEKDYNEKCDVYSYTVIAWEVMVRLHPYFHLKEINQFKLMLGVHKGKLKININFYFDLHLLYLLNYLRYI
jgi:hypothetical protein